MSKPFKSGKRAKPLRLREARAMMEMKELSLKEVAAQAGVVYSTASQLLNGIWIEPTKLNRLLNVIRRAPMPREGISL